MVKSGDLASGRGPLDFHYRWEGVGGSAQRLGDTNGNGGRVSGRRSEDFIVGKEQKKKKNCRWEGVSGRRSKDFIIGEEHKTITAGGKGVSGRSMEDFIIGEEHKTITAGGKGVSGRRMEDYYW